MKGFKNAFAAGALGIILAVTGCTQYDTPITDPANPINNGAATTTRGRMVTDVNGNRYATNTRRNFNVSRTAPRTMAVRDIGSTSTATNTGVRRTSPANSRYSSSAVTANRSRTATTGGYTSGTRVNTNNYGKNTVLNTNTDTHRQQISYTGRANSGVSTTGMSNRAASVKSGYSTSGINNRASRNIYTTGNVTQFPAANRGLNNTGSPFGDYNKDRAYSSTRGTAGMAGATAGMAGANYINSAASSTTGNRNAAITNAGEGAVVRKNFTEGTTRTRSASEGTAITAKTNNTKSTHKAMTGSTKKATKTKGTKATRATKKANTAAHTTGTAKTTKANTANQGAAQTTKANTTGTALTKNSNATGTNMTSAGGNVANLPRTGITGSTVNKNTSDAAYQQLSQAARRGTQLQNRTARANRGGFEGEAYNERNDYRTKTSRNSKAEEIKIRRSVSEIKDGRGMSSRGLSSSVLTENGAGDAYMINKAVRDRVNNSTGATRSRSANRSYSNYGNGHDIVRGTGNYDNLTFGNSYRNADLRNNYYTPGMYGDYSGLFGTNNVPNTSSAGMTRGTNAGTMGNYYGDINRGYASDINRNYGSDYNRNYSRSYGRYSGSDYDMYGMGYPSSYRSLSGDQTGSASSIGSIGSRGPIGSIGSMGTTTTTGSYGYGSSYGTSSGSSSMSGYSASRGLGATR